MHKSQIQFLLKNGRNWTINTEYRVRALTCENVRLTVNNFRNKIKRIQDGENNRSIGQEYFKIGTLRLKQVSSVKHQAKNIIQHQ